jgi:hypothetical protein
LASVLSKHWSLDEARKGVSPPEGGANVVELSHQRHSGERCNPASLGARTWLLHLDERRTAGFAVSEQKSARLLGQEESRAVCFPVVVRPPRCLSLRCYNDNRYRGAASLGGSDRDSGRGNIAEIAEKATNQIANGWICHRQKRVAHLIARTRLDSHDLV